MKVLIDDIRDIEDMDIICRNSTAGKAVLELFDIDELYLDNDLGETVEGYQILQWAANHGLVPEKVVLVTANPIAKQKMIDILTLDLNYTQDKIYRNRYIRSRDEAE